MSAAPLVRVVVVDHDGGDLTIRALRSAAASDWPADRLQVVLVENGSARPVVEAAREAVPGLRVVETGRNLGFAGGANAGMTDLESGELVALLNNDAAAEPDWLRHLAPALAGDRVGAAQPKVVLDASYARVELGAPGSRPLLTGRRPVGVRVSGARLGVPPPISLWPRTKPGAGCYAVLPGRGDEPPGCWCEPDAVLHVPVADDARSRSLSLRLEADRPKHVEVVAGGEPTHVHVGREPGWHEVALGPSRQTLVNSTGVRLVGDAYAADRGWLEPDDGRWDTPDEPPLWTGSAVLLRGDFVRDLGGFDERLFLYYEDVDLAWRGRLRGWTYKFVPEALVRHVHASTAGLASPLAVHHTERNHLVVATKLAPGRVAASLAVHHLRATASYTARDVVLPMLGAHRPDPTTVLRRLDAFGGYLRLAPSAVRARRSARAGADPALDALVRAAIGGG